MFLNPDFVYHKKWNLLGSMDFQVYNVSPGSWQILVMGDQWPVEMVRYSLSLKLKRSWKKLLYSNMKLNW